MTRDSEAEYLTALIDACVCGDSATAERLLNSQLVSVDSTDLRGRSSLWHSAARGRYSVASLLLRHLAQVDLTDRFDESPVGVAARYGHVTTVKLLLANGAKPVNIVSVKSVDIGCILIRSGADPVLWWTIVCSAELPALAENRLLTALISSHADVNPAGDSQADSPPIVAAAGLGRTPIVRRLLVEAGASCQRSAMSAESPLAAACRGGHFDTAKLLLEAGADPDDSSGSTGKTPLAISAEAGHQSVVRLLLDAQANPDLHGNSCRALSLAAQRGKLQVMDNLIRAQANVDLVALDNSAGSAFDSDVVISRLCRAQAAPDVQSMAVCRAVKRGSLSTVRYLIEAGADVNCCTKSSEESPLLLLCSTSLSRPWSTEMLQALLLSGADPDAQRPTDGLSCVHLAAVAGRTDSLATLISALARLDCRTLAPGGYLPLHLAARAGSVAMVTQLIKAGADVDSISTSGSTPIALATEAGHAEVASVLLQAQASTEIPKATGAIPLHLAAQRGHVGLLKLLIANQSDVDSQTGAGATPMYLAAQYGEAKAVEQLLSGALADADLSVDGGFTPLFVAAQRGCSEIVRILGSTSHPASPNCRTAASGATPLHAATLRRHPSAVRQLLLAGADPNLRRFDNGETALHSAARVGDLRSVRLLTGTGGGADPTALDGHGAAAWNVALSRGHVTVAEELRKMTPEIGSASANPERPKFTDSDLSVNLHRSLLKAGFHQLSACLHTAIVDATEAICRARLENDLDQESSFAFVHLSGSFADSWGCRLASTNGELDPYVELKLVSLVPGLVLHISGVCRCGGSRNLLPAMAGQMLELRKDGLLICKDGGIEDIYRVSPCTSPGSQRANIPAVISTSVIECCRHPSMSLFDADTQISDETMSQLKDELIHSRCYLEVVGADDESASLLQNFSLKLVEQRLLRCLTTVQGQLFVLLKYIIKCILPQLMHGLPENLEKMLLIEMLQSVPKLEFRAENLLELTRHSLRKLQNHVQDYLDNGFCFSSKMNGPRTRLNLQPKHTDPQQIIDAVDALIYDLPNQLHLYCSKVLKPSAQLFYYHPFLVMPDLILREPSEAQIQVGSDCSVQEYHQLYDYVRHLFLKLAAPRPSFTLANFLRTIDQLPTCLKTTGAALRTMAYLRQGDKLAALNAVRSHAFRAQCAIRYPRWLSDDLALNQSRANQLVQHFLLSEDCLWKFCFRFPQPESLIRLQFLPKFLRRNFPLELDGNFQTYLMNFDALLKCIYFELMTGANNNDQIYESWFSELLRPAPAPDEQQLLMTLRYCRSANIVQKIIAENDQLLGRSDALLEERDRAMERLAAQREATAQDLAEDLIGFFSQ